MTERRPLPAGPLDLVAQFIATGAGSGYFPIAPGTAGTLAAIPLYLLMAGLDPTLYLAVLLLLLLVGVWAADRVERRMGVEDPGLIVIDEVVGYLTTMALAPPMRNLVLVAGIAIPGSVVLGFFLFRFFDIVKVLGTARLERLPGGLGIVMDDYWAGVLANLVMRFGYWLAAGAAI